MANPPSHELSQAVLQGRAPDEKPNLTSRIERARQKLGAPAEDREPGDSRWQNWYSR